MTSPSVLVLEKNTVTIGRSVEIGRFLGTHCFHICGHFLLVLQGRKIVFFHFSLYSSLIAMDRSLQSDLAMVFKVAYASCLLLNCFL